MIEFFTIFIISLYFEELYPGTTQLKSTSRFDIHKAQHMQMFDYLTKTSIINFKELTVDSVNCFGWESNPYIRIQKYCLHSFNEYKPVRKVQLKDSILNDFSQQYKVTFQSAILAGPNLDHKEGNIFTTCLSLNYYQYDLQVTWTLI